MVCKCFGKWIVWFGNFFIFYTNHTLLALISHFFHFLGSHYTRFLSHAFCSTRHNNQVATNFSIFFFWKNAALNCHDIENTFAHQTIDYIRYNNPDATNFQFSFFEKSTALNCHDTYSTFTHATHDDRARFRIYTPMPTMRHENFDCAMADLATKALSRQLDTVRSFGQTPFHLSSFCSRPRAVTNIRNFFIQMFCQCYSFDHQISMYMFNELSYFFGFQSHFNF